MVYPCNWASVWRAAKDRGWMLAHATPSLNLLQGPPGHHFCFCILHDFYVWMFTVLLPSLASFLSGIQKIPNPMSFNEKENIIVCYPDLSKICRCKGNARKQLKCMYWNLFVRINQTEAGEISIILFHTQPRLVSWLCFFFMRSAIREQLLNKNCIGICRWDIFFPFEYIVQLKVRWSSWCIQDGERG